MPIFGYSISVLIGPQTLAVSQVGSVCVTSKATHSTAHIASDYADRCPLVWLCRKSPPCRKLAIQCLSYCSVFLVWQRSRLHHDLILLQLWQTVNTTPDALQCALVSGVFWLQIADIRCSLFPVSSPCFFNNLAMVPVSLVTNGSVLLSRYEWFAIIIELRVIRFCNRVTSHHCVLWESCITPICCESQICARYPISSTQHMAYASS